MADNVEKLFVFLKRSLNLTSKAADWWTDLTSQCTYSFATYLRFEEFGDEEEKQTLTSKALCGCCSRSPLDNQMTTSMFSDENS
jgi:hypothetical protein